MRSAGVRPQIVEHEHARRQKLAVEAKGHRVRRHGGDQEPHDADRLATRQRHDAQRRRSEQRDQDPTDRAHHGHEPLRPITMREPALSTQAGPPRRQRTARGRLLACPAFLYGETQHAYSRSARQQRPGVLVRVLSPQDAERGNRPSTRPSSGCDHCSRPSCRSPTAPAAARATRPWNWSDASSTRSASRRWRISPALGADRDEIHARARASRWRAGSRTSWRCAATRRATKTPSCHRRTASASRRSWCSSSGSAALTSAWAGPAIRRATSSAATSIKT